MTAPEIIWPLSHAIAYCIGVVVVALVIAWLMDACGREK